MATPRRTTVFLDRIEGSKAVMVLDDGTAFELPAALLPRDAEEGAVLTLALSVDPDETRRRREAIRARRDRLGDDDDDGDLTL